MKCWSLLIIGLLTIDQSRAFVSNTAVNTKALVHVRDLSIPDDDCLNKWMSTRESLQTLIDEPGRLVYLMKSCWDRVSVLLPALMSYFSDACQISPNGLVMESWKKLQWLCIQNEILRNAPIDVIKILLKNEKLRLFLRETDWIILARSLSSRACFKAANLEAQEDEVNILVESDIFNVQENSLVYDLSRARTFYADFPEILLKSIFKFGKISLREPKLAFPFARMFSWELVDEVLSNCNHNDITEKDWIMILMAGAHFSWEKFESLYALVQEGICPKWLIFCKSLSYSAIEGFSDKLWEEEEVRRAVKSAKGYQAVLLYSEDNDKYLKKFLKDEDFNCFMVENIGKIPFEKLPTKTVDVLLSSERIKDLFKKTFSYRNPVELLRHYLVKMSAPFGKIFMVCFLIKIDREAFSGWIEDLIDQYNHENLFYFSEKFWSQFDKSNKESVINYHIAEYPTRPFLKLLDEDKSATFKLSCLTESLSHSQKPILELFSYLDSIEVDNLLDITLFPVNRDLVKTVKGSRKHSSRFGEKIKCHRYDLDSYSWAAKYCVFHENLPLMIQLGFHLLLDVKQESSNCVYTTIALEIASFIFYSYRLPIFLPTELVRVISQSRLREAKFLLRAHYKI